MVMLAAAGIAFLAIHLLISGTRLRDGIVGAIGEGPYLGLFALLSLATLVWLAISYNAASMSSENRVLYDLGRGVHDSGILIIAVAFLLGVQGILMPNPTSIRHGAAAAKEANIKGVLRITRHPFLWGVVIWSAFHMAANGDLASVLFFGTFLVVAFLGTFSIDAKRKRKMGSVWDAFAAKTSNVPFAAIISGRSTLNFGESLGRPFWIAAAVFLAVLFAHYYLFHASPFPGGWIPY
jgi:uncharacterized membrane protein